MALASQQVRESAKYRWLSSIWDAYRRDAGEATSAASTASAEAICWPPMTFVGIASFWLLDHTSPTLSKAALAARMVGANRRFVPDEYDLLAGAIDAFSEAQRGSSPSAARAASPGGCRAANLALQARAPRLSLPIPPTTLSRALFRFDLDEDEQTDVLRSDWSRALDAVGTGVLEIHRKLERGIANLARLSKNARARPAWSLLAGFGVLRRGHLFRALGLSRGGGAPCHAAAGGRCTRSARCWRHYLSSKQHSGVARALDGSLFAAAREVDRAMADLDRLLASAVGSS